MYKAFVIVVFPPPAGAVSIATFVFKQSRIALICFSLSSKGKFFIYELVKPNSPERLPYWLSDFNLDKKLITNMKEGKVLLEERFSTDENGVFSKKIKLPE